GVGGGAIAYAHAGISAARIPTAAAKGSAATTTKAANLRIYGLHSSQRFFPMGNYTPKRPLRRIGVKARPYTSAWGKRCPGSGWFGAGFFIGRGPIPSPRTASGDRRPEGP